MIRAVYFDLDDTLCGYWSASTVALAAAFKEHAPKSHTHQQLVEHWGQAFRDFLPEVKTDKWYPGYLVSGEATRTEQLRRTLVLAGIPDDGLSEKISQSYMQLRNEGLRLFDDALDVLNALKPRYPLGLITNGPADIQRMEIEALGIGHFFQNIFIEGEMKIGKPHQEVFRRAAEAVDLGPDDLMFVGNSYGHDIRPAIQAGWTTAWIRRPSDVPPSSASVQSKPEERPSDAPAPTYEIRELSELLPILAK